MTITVATSTISRARFPELVSSVIRAAFYPTKHDKCVRNNIGSRTTRHDLSEKAYWLAISTFRKAQRVEQILGVAIGIVLICLLLSIIASHMREVMAAFTAKRAVMLEAA